MLLALCMVVTMLPVTAMAEEIHTLISTSGEIINFAQLTETEKKVSLGISIEDLELPEKVTATVRTAVIAGENPAQDSGSLDGDTVTDNSAIATDNSITAVTDSEWLKTTTEIPVTWESTPEYDMNTEGVYVFAPMIVGYTVSAALPEITVKVGAVHTIPLTIVPQVVNVRFRAPITIGSNTDVSCEFIILTEPDGDTKGTVCIYGSIGTGQQLTGDLIIPETVTNSGNTYAVWVGGIQVSSANKDNIAGNGMSGTITYAPETKTLTMNGATIPSTANYVMSSVGTYGIYASEDLKIQLVGTNSVTVAHTTSDDMGSVGISVGTFSSLTIDGSGSLTAQGGNVLNPSYQSSGIATYNLTINSGTVTARGNLSSGRSVGIFSSNLLNLKGGNNHRSR